MTVQYNGDVATAKFVGLLRLLVRWKGSIFKLVWPELLVYLALHAIVAVIYNFALKKSSHKRQFEEYSQYCDQSTAGLPVTFVLGFYVSSVVSRWWEIYKEIPTPQRLALLVTAGLQGQEDLNRLTRRTIMRYTCVGFVLTMMSISPAVKKRFTSLNSLSESGMLMVSEQRIIENLNVPHNKFYVPFVWAATLVHKARKQGIIKDDYTVQTILDEIVDFRGKCQRLFCFDWINIPLAYTQVATIIVYVFFFGCLFGRQKLEQTPTGEGQTDDKCIVPIFTILQFLFYMGWLKVAEELMCPFGDDDDDFDINPIIDKNIEVSYTIVDEMHAEIPQLIKDTFWDKTEVEIPYTEASLQYQSDAYQTDLTDHIKVADEKLVFIKEEDEDAPEHGRRGTKSLFFRKGSHVPAANVENSPAQAKP